MDSLGAMELSQEAFDSGLETLAFFDCDLLDGVVDEMVSETPQNHQRYETPLLLDLGEDTVEEKDILNEKRKISPDGIDQYDSMVVVTNHSSQEKLTSPPPISKNSSKRKKLSKPQPTKNPSG
jgi:hypothetical protein